MQLQYAVNEYAVAVRRPLSTVRCRVVVSLSLLFVIRTRPPVFSSSLSRPKAFVSASCVFASNVCIRRLPAVRCPRAWDGALHSMAWHSIA